MGKGDQRTKRGKIWRGTHGRLRPGHRKRQPPVKRKSRPSTDKEKTAGAAASG